MLNLLDQGHLARLWHRANDFNVGLVRQHLFFDCREQIMQIQNPHFYSDLEHDAQQGHPTRPRYLGRYLV